MILSVLAGLLFGVVVGVILFWMFLFGMAGLNVIAAYVIASDWDKHIENTVDMICQNTLAENSACDTMLLPAFVAFVAVGACIGILIWIFNQK